MHLQHRQRWSLASVVTVVALATLGTGTATAHVFSNHWHRGGANVTMNIWDQTGGCGTAGTATNDALWDIHNNPHPIYINCVGQHSDISVFQDNHSTAYPNDHCGLAEHDFDSNGHFTHSHAHWNAACSSVSGLTGKAAAQGIFCQEVLHSMGRFQHTDVGDCMGLTYFSGSNGKYFSGNTGAYVSDWDHTTSDIYNRYRNHG